MSYKDPNKAKEYMKEWYQANKEQRKVYHKAYYQANKDKVKAKKKDWREANKEQIKAYNKADLNSLGQNKGLIRQKSLRYLSKYGKKIPGYEIHHCSGYTEPYKFIYCSIEMHNLIHAYLRQHNISADSDHYEQIKHLLDDTVVLYGLE